MIRAAGSVGDGVRSLWNKGAHLISQVVRLVGEVVAGRGFTGVGPTCQYNFMQMLCKLLHLFTRFWAPVTRRGKPPINGKSRGGSSDLSVDKYSRFPRTKLILNSHSASLHSPLYYA